VESDVLYRALRDFNIPKILADDNIIFSGLLNDLFPGAGPSMQPWLAAGRLVDDAGSWGPHRPPGWLAAEAQAGRRLCELTAVVANHRRASHVQLG
jgi:hypothetical protein